ncbi:hypothetical protein DFQ28_009656 [Apophysomyces sp. BC1034]|nr:hypothetical protein DFQ30_009903 [Apophysomyces sp. BC1015]KAG0182103.1 hypothetical protein DFQ29_005797 [Apophysomyces sp. BC1021]KAG0192251.1 hypothetical protein DFQ28_009656 [Apophysomyces sp. BC1034]
MAELSTIHSSNTSSPKKSSATSQYHAQLFSGQQKLQQRQLQQSQQPQKDRTKPSDRPTKLPQRPFDVLTIEPPNLYYTSLKLATEISINAWWKTMADLMVDSGFHATRIALSVPQDPNDPWTGPWGLKAVFNKKGATYRDHPEKASDHPTDTSYFVHNTIPNERSIRPRHVPCCFDRLQSFESEPEPLINNPSVQRILRRSAPVVISREYRQHSSHPITSRRLKKEHLEDAHDMFKRALLEQTEKSSRRLNWNPPVITTPCLHKLEEGETTELFTDSEILVDSSKMGEDVVCRLDREDAVGIGAAAFLHNYDEYEQQQPSPWSQSPAPSPAMMDPDVNPFFQSVPNIDDEAFNPASPESYISNTVPFPLPISNVHSVVHVPLVHPFEVKTPSPLNQQQERTQPPTPMAILSLLSPVVPYPPVLLSSLLSLAPFIATSLSNAIANERGSKQDHNDHRTPRSSNTHYSDRLSNHSLSNQVDSSSEAELTLSTQHVAKGSVFLPGYPTQTSTERSFDQLHTKSSAKQVSRSLDIDIDVSSASSEGSTLSAPAELTRIKTIPKDISDALTRDKNQTATTLSHMSNVPPSKTVLRSSPSSLLPSEYSVDPTTSSEQTFTNTEKQRLTMSEPKLKSDQPTENENTEVTLCQGSLHGRLLKSQRRRKHKSKRRCHRKQSGYLRSKDPLDEEEFRCQNNKLSGRTKDGNERILVPPKSSMLRLVIDGIAIHVFTCSTTTGQITWVNNRTLQYTGRSLQDHLGPRWLSHMHPDDQADCRKAWKTAFELGNGFAGEYRLRRFDGAYRCFLWRVVPLRDFKGRIIHWFGTCTDVHDQHIEKESSVRQMEIENNERKYRLLAEAIPQIVFTFSPAAGLTYANGKWESYSGQPFDRTVGLGFMSQVHPDDRQKLQLPDLPPLKTAGVTWQNEIRLLSGEGEYKWFLVKCISVDEMDSPDVRWFGTCTDINDHKLLEHKLKEAHDAAQKSTESKTRFLSNMSHEIRTPLIGITGMLNFLLDTELTPEQLDYAHTIQQSAESLLVVINDILDLSKVEAGMMKLEWEPFSLVTMIEDANELLSTLAIQKGLELSFWVDCDVPDVVVGDRVRLRQVLLNLIGNAIKFTTEGEVFTQCSMQRLDNEESELTLLFEVVDTGAGFDADGEAVMFKPFSQIDSSSTRKHGGSGLGLVISRQLIELHGGEMKCKSKKGEGSSFYFTVKFGIPASQTRPQPQTPQNEMGSDPFFRMDGYPIGQDTLSVHTNDTSDSSTFGSSPLAHSKKHSQASEIPSSADLLHDALMNKAASMQLHPPPVRGTKAPQKSEELVLVAANKAMKEETRKTRPEIKMPTLGTSSGLSSPGAGAVLPLHTPSRGPPPRVLIVSEWNHSRNTMAKHVRSILSNFWSDHEYQVTVSPHHDLAMKLLADPQEAAYDYIMINLKSEQQILSLTSSVCNSPTQRDANVLVLTSPIQRSSIMESAKNSEDDVIPHNCGFVFKPIKRSKLNWYFGIQQGGSSSDAGQEDSAPDASHRRVTTQREIFRKMEMDVGGKGFRVLLVEDNPVNQKVLTRYLVRVGLNVDIAGDGEECVKAFFSNPPNYYSLILCDLFMPVKDGYEATREIREWESQHRANERPIPIVALSANVMSDVATTTWSTWDLMPILMFEPYLGDLYPE